MKWSTGTSGRCDYSRIEHHDQRAEPQVHTIARPLTMVRSKLANDCASISNEMMHRMLRAAAGLTNLTQRRSSLTRSVIQSPFEGSGWPGKTGDARNRLRMHTSIRPLGRVYDTACGAGSGVQKARRSKRSLESIASSNGSFQRLGRRSGFGSRSRADDPASKPAR